MPRSYKVIAIIVYALLVFAPPIANGYIYPNGGDDSAMHLTILKSGDLFHQVYVGYVFVGYPIRWLSMIGLSINVIFLWFNYLTLFGVGIANYFMLSKWVNDRAGIVALITPFVGQGILYQFDFGQIFNIINIGIFLPLTMYHGVKLIDNQSTGQFVRFYLFALLFSLFHSTGIYLTPVVLGGLVIYKCYSLYRNTEYHSKVLWVLPIVPVNLAIQYFLTNSFTMKVISLAGTGTVLDYRFIIKIISLGFIAVILAFIFSKRYWKEVKLFVIAVLLSTVLVTAMFVSPVPDRQLYDLAIVLGFIVGMICGMVSPKTYQGFIVVLGLSAVASFPGWFSYHNAIQPTDKMAIEYMNEAQFETFSVSSEVTPNVYWNYVKQGYIDTGGELLIVRNTPQTNCSDKSTRAYVPHGIGTRGYSLLKTFDNDGVKVEVYAIE